jgi:spermidine synthase
VTGGFRQWRNRWQNSLGFLAELSETDFNVELTERPIEQSTGLVITKTTLKDFVAGMQKWPTQAKPVRPLYWAEESLVTYSKDADTSICPLLTNHERSEACNTLAGFLFQDFGWVGPVFGQHVSEVEVSIWAGPRGSRTGLHADIEPFNLLVVLSGRKRVTMWPAALRPQVSVSSRYDNSAEISEIDVFDPLVEEKFPIFAEVRHLNYTVEMEPGDVLHIPTGWWHVAENLESSVAATFHVWQWDWSEFVGWLPHAILESLHIRGLYKQGDSTNTHKSQKLSGSYYDALGGEDLGDKANCSAGNTTIYVPQIADAAETLHTDASSVAVAPEMKEVRSSAPAEVLNSKNQPPPGTGTSPKVREEWKLLHSTKTAYQALAVWHEKVDGNRYLLLNGDIQLTAKGEYIYHEMLSYVPLAAALCAPQGSNSTATEDTKPQLRVFLFGAGDGGIAQRLLWHPFVEHVLQVEIDEAVVNASQTYFPELQPDLQEAGMPSRHTLLIGDGIQFAQRAASGKLAGTFDIVILDTTDIPLDADGNVIGLELFTPMLYENLAKMLRPGGVLTQNSQSMDGVQAIRWLKKRIGLSFGHVMPYVFATPDYLSPFFSMLALKDWPTPPQPHSRSCARKLLKPRLKGRKLKYYSEAVHAASFVLPAMLADMSAPDLYQGE